MSWTLLENSLLVSTLGTLLAVAFGVASALWVVSLDSRGRVWFLGTAVVALALPPFVVTSCWLYLLGHTGVWRSWLPLSIYTKWGTIWILALLNWPITLFLVLGAWQRLEPSQLESEPSMRGWPMIRWLLLPMAKPALRLAAVLTLVLILNNFAVPAILQTKVYAAELWVNFSTTFDYGAALRLSWPLLLAPMLMLLWLNQRGISWPAVEGSVSSKLFRNHLGAAWLWGSGSLAILLIVVAVGLPLGQLISLERTWTELPSAFAAGQVAFWNSFTLAVSGSTLSVVVGLAIWRWRFGFLFWVPFLVPGVLLGITLIFALNRPGFTAFYQSAGIVVLGFTLRYLALSWKSAAQAMRSIDPDLTDTARLCGASAWQILRHVQWPQIAPSIAAAWYVTYLFCLWDVETLVLIVPPGCETLALRVFNLLHYGWNDQVNALCILLLALALLPLLLWSAGRSLMRLVTENLGRFLESQALCAFSLLIIGTAGGCSPATSNQARIDSRLFSSVQVIGGRGTALGQFNKPRSVAVDAEDNLYVVDMTGRVQKFSPGGEFVLSWQMPQTDLGKPKGMCRDGDGNIVVIEPHYSRVNHFSPGGKLIAQWGDNGTQAGQLAFPRAAVANSKGEIYVSEYGKVERVQKFSARGREFLRTIGGAGAENGRFNRAEGLGLDRQDRLYVADSCNHRIQVFAADGSFLMAYGRAGSGPGELSYPYDIQVDATGRQYVCEFGNSRVQIFDEQGRSLEILGSVGSAPGKFSNPWGLALDSKGNLYVADSMNHRVQKFIR